MSYESLMRKQNNSTGKVHHVNLKKLKPQTRERIRRGCIGGTLQWIDSWGENMDIRSSGFGLALQACPDRIALRDIIVDWKFNWEVEYTVYCRMPDGQEYEQPVVIQAPGVSINDLTEAVYGTAKAKALAAVNHKHIYDQGWKARIVK